MATAPRSLMGAIRFRLRIQTPYFFPGCISGITRFGVPRDSIDDSPNARQMLACPPACPSVGVERDVVTLAMVGHRLRCFEMARQSWIELVLTLPIVLWAGRGNAHRL